MDQEAKKILSILVALGLAGLIYYGSYLPYVKSASLVSTMNYLQNGGGNGTGVTLQEFENSFAALLSIPSPVGQYETIRQLDSTIGSVLTNTTNIPEQSAAELASFALKYTQPIINSGTGANFVQNFVNMGDIYREMGSKYNNKQYYDIALRYYKEGLSYSPRRPQFLYGELSIYLGEQDNADAISVAKQIVSYWPADTNTQSILKQLEAPEPSKSSKK